MVYYLGNINTYGVKMSSKINWLVSHTAPNSIILQQWLVENGIPYSLTQKYVKNGWLKKFDTGAY